MSIPLQGLRTVIHSVGDITRARDWWRDLLGIDPYFDEPFYIGFNVAGYELGLIPSDSPDDGAHVYWGVGDLNGALDEALRQGATVYSPAQDVGEGIVTAMITTPDGSHVGFIFNAHFTLP